MVDYRSMEISIILLIIGVVILLWGVISYNRFISGKNRIAEAWADIDVQLKRRYDMIPNLIETVRGYAAHEQQTLDRVVNARNAALNAEQSGDVIASARAENELSGVLKSIFALSENYPDLKANTNFLELQRELRDTEDKIQAARRFYNANVRDFNILTESVPSNIIASVGGFVKQDLFDLDTTPDQRENITVKF